MLVYIYIYPHIFLFPEGDVSYDINGGCIQITPTELQGEGK